MAQPLIHVDFLAGFSALVLEHGGNPDVLCAQVGLQPERDKHEGLFVPLAQYVQLVELTSRSISVPCFAMELAKRQAFAHFRQLHTLVQASNNIGIALKILSRHAGLKVQGMKFVSHVDIANELLHISVSCESGRMNKSVLMQEYFCAGLVTLIELMRGKKLTLRSIMFPHADDSRALTYKRYFNCPVGFDHTQLRISLPSSLLAESLSSPTAPSGVHSQVKINATSQRGFAEQVKLAIDQLLMLEDFNAQTVCKSMGVGNRTLQRRLKQANTSYQELVDEVRYEQAVVYLRTPGYRVTDIAALLGYSDLSAFTRSFKRWVGMSPLEWRSVYGVQDQPELPESAFPSATAEHSLESLDELG